jgi:hypothetical protein
MVPTSKDYNYMVGHVYTLRGRDDMYIVNACANGNAFLLNLDTMVTKILPCCLFDGIASKFRYLGYYPKLIKNEQE